MNGLPLDAAAPQSRQASTVRRGAKRGCRNKKDRFSPKRKRSDNNGVEGRVHAATSSAVPPLQPRNIGFTSEARRQPAASPFSSHAFSSHASSSPRGVSA